MANQSQHRAECRAASADRCPTRFHAIAPGALLPTIRRGVLIGLATCGLAVTGTPTAVADGLDCQSGCVIDWDGTTGGFDNDGTKGTIRSLNMTSSSGHSIVSDACFVSGQGCMPGASSPSTISATTGAVHAPGSALDPDGFQAANVRNPAVVAAPGLTATPGTTATRSGGFYYPH